MPDGSLSKSQTEIYRRSVDDPGTLVALVPIELPFGSTMMVPMTEGRIRQRIEDIGRFSSPCRKSTKELALLEEVLPRLAAVQACVDYGATLFEEIPLNPYKFGQRIETARRNIRQEQEVDYGKPRLLAHLNMSKPPITLAF